MEKINNEKELEVLLELGLSEKEARIYFAALDSGGSSIADLAKFGGIERTGIYYHIKKLVELGLLNAITKGKRTVFMPGNPEKFKRMAERRQEHLLDVLPGMVEQYSRKTSKSITEYFVGSKELNKFYDKVYAVLTELSKQDNDICVLGTSYRSAVSRGKAFLDFVVPEQQLDVKIRCILPQSQKSKNPEENAMDPYIVTRYNLSPAELKYIPDKYQYPSAVLLTKNKIMQYDFDNLIFSITENKNMAGNLRMFFEYVWDTLK